MERINIEIKARYRDLDTARSILQSKGARFEGTDRQVDTYFSSAEGRLKLREGGIERGLIFYARADKAGPKWSDVLLTPLHSIEQTARLKKTLEHACGIDVVVEKVREIYFLDNVKVHLDQVEGLGTFVEIEAIGTPGETSEERLQQQCRGLMDALRIEESGLEPASYSDMVRR